MMLEQCHWLLSFGFNALRFCRRIALKLAFMALETTDMFRHSRKCGAEA